MRNKLFYKVTCIILTASILAGICSNFAKRTSASDAVDERNDAFSDIETITRVYDTSPSGSLRYYYVDENGNRVDISHSTESNSKNTTFSLKQAATLPASYDLREQNLVTSIKNQGITGSCWAFAALKSIESNIISKGYSSAENTDLSESHLVWHTLHTPSSKTDAFYGEGISHSYTAGRSTYLLGGSAILAVFSLSRWSGAVYEATASFSGDSIAQVDTMASNMAAAKDSARYRKNYILTNATCYDNATQDQIKEAIMTNGAMDVSYYYDKSYDHNVTEQETCYYQTKYNGETAIDNANHSVSIVGWDDDYPKENFGNTPPSSDGAWLIAGSYGASYAANGYFWLSYEEPSLVEFYSFEAEKAAEYDNNYQYDSSGWGTGIILSDSSSITGANIFTANENYTQALKAIGIYTLTNNQPYNIKIYKGVTAGKPTSGTLAATLTGTQELSGYHTLTLPNPVSLKAGEKFSVVITYERTNSNNGYLPMEGKSASHEPLSISYTSHTGESFLYTYLSENTTKNWGWYDIKTHGNESIQNNICLKAFTINQSPAGSLSLSKTSVKLGKGETFKLKATPKNVTNKTVTYSSANTAVASVDSTGKITAKKVGKTKITATLSTGRSASITVTVKKAPKKVKLKPSKKKTIRRKKSFTIKVKLSSGSASNKITFTSSKPKVATVNSKGKVVGKKKGTAVITVKTYNKKKAKLKVKVK